MPGHTIATGQPDPRDLVQLVKTGPTGPMEAKKQVKALYAAAQPRQRAASLSNGRRTS